MLHLSKNYDTALSDFTVLIYFAHAASFHWCSCHDTSFSGTVQVTSIHQSPQTVSLCTNWVFPNLAWLIWSPFFLMFSNTDYDCFDTTLLVYWDYWYIINHILHLPRGWKWQDASYKQQGIFVDLTADTFWCLRRLLAWRLGGGAYEVKNKAFFFCFCCLAPFKLFSFFLFFYFAFLSSGTS